MKMTDVEDVEVVLIAHYKVLGADALNYSGWVSFTTCLANGS